VGAEEEGADAEGEESQRAVGCDLVQVFRQVLVEWVGDGGCDEDGDLGADDPNGDVSSGLRSNGVFSDGAGHEVAVVLDHFAGEFLALFVGELLLVDPVADTSGDGHNVAGAAAAGAEQAADAGDYRIEHLITPARRIDMPIDAARDLADIF